MKRVVLASGNPGKLREFQDLLAPTGIELVSQRALGIADADEPFGTFLENALTKARHASVSSGAPALADDSGVCVPALAGAPGVHSARYAQQAGGPRSDAANNAHLLAQLRGRPPEQWQAYYYCVLVFVRSADDPQPLVADGYWHGEIIEQPRGGAGFGYDPHFLLPDLGKTAAELEPSEKNRRSHRGQALQALLARLVQGRVGF